MQQHPFIFSQEKRYRFRRHLIFWIFWGVFFGFLYSYTAKISLLPNFQRLPIAAIDSLLFLIPHMFLTYSLIYYIIPKFILTGKYLKAGVIIFLFFILTASISTVIGSYVLPVVRFFLFSIDINDPVNSSYLLSLLAGLRGAITIGGFAAAIKLMKYWYLKEQRNLQLQKENAEAQLQLLRAQIHPHFLFNTLNNIYSYTQNTSSVASKMITDLSDLLRFILYAGNQPLVSLQMELKMIQDYINLEKIRYGNRLDLHLDIPTQTDGLSIAPMLLLPLVENCFKHGSSNMLEQPWINLQINIQEKQFQMKLINGKANGQAAKQQLPGIGIKNVQKRLVLLYPQKHELTITNEDEVFIINLKLELEQKKEEISKSQQQPEISHA